MTTSNSNWFSENGNTCMCGAYKFTHEAGSGRCKAQTPSLRYGTIIGYYAGISRPSLVISKQSTKENNQ